MSVLGIIIVIAVVAILCIALSRLL